MESDTFTKEFLIPHCHYVGYKHTIEDALEGKWRFVDSFEYENSVIDDKEFRRLREEWQRKTSKKP
jgi:hypothetical protein